MPMREDCRHFETRTYGSGETVRMCRLDLAPEAPWRCPENCAAYDPRKIDAGWHPGTLRPSPPPPEPTDLRAASELLDAAEDIINSAGPNLLAEEERRRQEARQPRRKWWPFGRR